MIQPLARLGLLAITQLATAQVVYVHAHATGANNGSSWSDAYVDLQTALGATASGEIWVAAGTYHPAPPGGSPLASFALRSNVQIYGGFVGIETKREERDPGRNETTLSGDLAGDDGPAGMPTVLALGAPATPFLLLPFGALWFDPTLFATVPLGLIPATVTLDAPAGAFDVVLQAVVAAGTSGQLSNPVALALR